MAGGAGFVGTGWSPSTAPHHSVARRLRAAAGAGLGTLVFGLGALAGAAHAQDRDVPLHFLPPTDAPVTGYQAYVTDVATLGEEIVDLGFVAADPDGVARTTVMLDASRDFQVGMTAYNDVGESELSNQIHVAADAPVCDPAQCDDRNPCTADACDPVDGCFSTRLPEGTLCDDGFVDTIDDQCVQGVCEGILLACRGDSDCDDGDVCNGAEVCDGGSVCLQGLPPDCGEPTPCTVPRCDALDGCWTDLLPDATPCTDAAGGIQAGVCGSGACQGDVAAELAIDAVEPRLLTPGRHTILVYGDGFADGAEVSFRNGKGRPPKVNAVRLLDDATLEVNVDVSRKGPKRGRSFDLVVTLPDGREAGLRDAVLVQR